jgi:hypothetical protein
MKRAIQVKGELSPQEIQFPRVMSKLRESRLFLKLTEDPLSGFGLVYTTPLPEFLKPSLDKTLSFLNKGRDKPFSISSKRWLEPASLVYGKGSVPSHEDGVSGISLLTFLGGFHPSGDLNPVEIFDLFYEGELYTGDRRTTLRVGSSLVFDDRETHSWMHNAGWVFMCSPLSEGR